MNVGKAIYGILSNNSGVTDLVGTRIYPVIVPQKASFPAIVYNIENVEPYDTKDGVSSLDAFKIQVFSFSDEYNEVADISTAARTALDRYAHSTVQGIKLQGIRYETSSETMDEELDLFKRVDIYQVRVKNE